MQQYFSKKRKENILYLNEEDIHHIKNVMRIKENDKLIVNYEGISYLCLLNKNYKSALIKSIYKEGTEDTYITAYVPVLNDEKLKFIIEKGTEMGVSKFILVDFHHSKFKINKEKLEKKLERYSRIAKEASEQARRLIIPNVEGIININDISKTEGVNIMCSLDKENVKHINKVLTLDTLYDRINLVFGPEGGISKQEESVLEEKGYIKTSLGKNVLRTETVIVCICSIINYVKGE